MLDKTEKVYLVILVTSVIILIFTALYITNNCPECDRLCSKKDEQPIIVYQI